MSPHGTTPRLDLLAPLHKALRRCMFDTLVRVGRLDAARADTLGPTLAAVERLLGVLAEPAPGLRATLWQLRGGARGPARGDEAPRALLAARLYRELASLVTARLQRIEDEEAEANAALWQAHDDADLRALRQRQFAAMSVDERREAVAWMRESLSPQELAQVLEDLHAGVDEPLAA